MYTYVFEVHVHDQAFILLNFLSLQPHDPRVPYVMVTKKLTQILQELRNLKIRVAKKKTFLTRKSEASNTCNGNNASMSHDSRSKPGTDGGYSREKNYTRSRKELYICRKFSRIVAMYYYTWL